MNAAEEVRQIRQTLAAKGSARVAAGSQRFFTKPVVSYGWRSAALDRYGRDLSRRYADKRRLRNLVADQLSRGRPMEEFLLACFLLERPQDELALHFALYERLLERITDWARCDCLGMRLLGPAVLQEPKLAARALRWARHPNRWHRRAAAVMLVLPARRGLHQTEVARVAGLLVADEDLMVQKGVGWLLRELGKYQPAVAVKLLARLRNRASRLVLRTACERLTARDKARLLLQ